MRRGIAENDLHQQRQQHRAAVEDEADKRHQEGSDRIRAILEDGKIQHRMFRRQLAYHQSRQTHHRQNAEDDDEVRAEPVIFLAFIEHDLQTADADRQQADTPEIDAAFLAGRRYGGSKMKICVRISATTPIGTLM